MIDHNTDFFKIEDNFARTANIPSIAITESKLDFVPKVTIAIPTYKRAELLKESLNSAINQINFNDYEFSPDTVFRLLFTICKEKITQNHFN